jgi:hypothetical protein
MELVKKILKIMSQLSFHYPANQTLDIWGY